jgi:hypothetical protein
MSKERTGEGNKSADRRYREGAQKTAETTTAEERARKARELAEEEKGEVRDAEEKGKSRARS